MFRNHVRDLAEWIEFHRLVGAEHFFLYNNASTEDWESVLGPYVEAGLATVHRWDVFPGLTPAFDDCLERHRHDSHWIAFIDVDEFVFSPTGATVPDVLRDFDGVTGVGVNRVPFGTSGHVSRPEGLVIENYLRCARIDHRNNVIKSIVHPPAVAHCVGAHHFVYREGRLAVDELHRPLDPAVQVGPRKRGGDAFTQTFSIERLRVNHYITKSLDEYRAKMAQPRPDTGGERGVPHLDWQLERLDGSTDEAILPYVPRVRAALDAAR